MQLPLAKATDHFNSRSFLTWLLLQERGKYLEENSNWTSAIEFHAAGLGFVFSVFFPNFSVLLSEV